MSRARKKRQRPSVSLFPFLAVLICTLGVLIVMLVLAAKSADQSASEKLQLEQQQHEQALAQLQAQIDLQQVRFAGLKRMRPQVLARLDQSRKNRERLLREVRQYEQDLDAVRKQAQIVRASLQQARAKDQSEIEPFDNEAAEQQLSLLREQLEQQSMRLQQRRKQVPQAGPNRYAIVPFKGEGGTFRRPIYIECTAEGLTLQPAGIKIAKEEFRPPLQPGNMLDAALLTIRDYWQRYDLAGDQGSPYPLLVVRPDGAETFVIARRAMQSWDDEFGYELVDAGKSLEFGKIDPQLAQEVSQTIDEARSRQRQLMAIRMRAERGAAYGPARGVAGGTRATNGTGIEAENRAGVSNAFAFDSGSNAGREHVRQVGGTGSQPLGLDGEYSSENPVDQKLLRIAAGKTLTGSDQSVEQGRESKSNEGPRSGAEAGAAGAESASNGNLAAGKSYGVDSLANQRGAGWALPTKTSGATGYLRPVRVICSADALEVPTAESKSRVISFNSGTPQAIDVMVDELWKLIDSWGIAGSGSYWKPQLRVTIRPGGEERFAELQALMHRSGLVLEQGAGK